MSIKKTPKRCLSEIAWQALHWNFTRSIKRGLEPGWYLLNKVSEEDRDLLKKLKSDDIKKDGLINREK